MWDLQFTFQILIYGKFNKILINFSLILHSKLHLKLLNFKKIFRTRPKGLVIIFLSKEIYARAKSFHFKFYIY